MEVDGEVGVAWVVLPGGGGGVVTVNFLTIFFNVFFMVRVVLVGEIVRRGV